MKAWKNWFSASFLEFLNETTRKTHYKIVNLFECPKTSNLIVTIQLSSRHFVDKYIRDLVVDNELIDYLDSNTVRTLTYMATIEHLSPDCSVISNEMASEVEQFLFKYKSSRDNTIFEKSPSEISRDKTLLRRFSVEDANRIGYLAGITETVQEYQLKKSKVAK